jgi:hypothetical protein
MTLWPLSRGTTADYVRELVYENFRYPGRLIRLDAPVVEIFAGDEIAGDQATMDNARRAAEEVTRATGGAVRLVVVAARSFTTPVFHLRLDPSLGPPAIARLYVTAGYRITGGDLVFRGIEFARGFYMLHEMGHGLGFGHSIDRLDVMGAGGTSLSFTPRESLALSMMYQRPHGNAYPDDDADIVRVASASGNTATITFICHHE